MSATTLNQPVMVSRGKNVDEKNIRAKNSGNIPCTASADPVRSASSTPRPPIGIANSAARTITISAPTTPPCTVAPKINAISRKNVAWPAARTTLAHSRLTRIAEREAGDDASRSKNPPSMSTGKERAGADRRDQDALHDGARDGEAQKSVDVREARDEGDRASERRREDRHQHEREEQRREPRLREAERRR